MRCSTVPATSSMGTLGSTRCWVDAVDSEPLERRLHGVLDVAGLTVDDLLSVDEVDAELGGDDDSVTDRPERWADELFVAVRPVDVDLGSVEERDAQVGGGPDDLIIS